MAGVVEPDQKPDYMRVGKRKRPVHHHDVPRARWDNEARATLVQYYVRLALYYYARREFYEAGRALGRALHYVQDEVIPSLGREHKTMHDNIEQELERFIIALARGAQIQDAPQHIREAALRALGRTRAVIRKFVHRLRHKPTRQEVLRCVRLLRVAKLLSIASLLFIAPALVGMYVAPAAGAALLLFVGIPGSVAVGLYRPRKLVEQMIVTGLLKPKPPKNYEVAMR